VFYYMLVSRHSTNVLRTIVLRLAGDRAGGSQVDIKYGVRPPIFTLPFIYYLVCAKFSIWGNVTLEN